MKDLMRLAGECERELAALGIRCGTVCEWSVNTRAKSRWGQCREIAPGQFAISIAASLLQDEVDETAVKSTILHELLHTVEGGMGHKGRWRELADRVNRACPEYRIRRTASPEEKGIACGARPRRSRYQITCRKCGLCAFRQRASRLVLHPERYRCGRCGGMLTVAAVTGENNKD